jgi:hypothetical protein
VDNDRSKNPNKGVRAAAGAAELSDIVATTRKNCLRRVGQSGAVVLNSTPSPQRSAIRWQVELFFKWIKQHPRITRNAL